MSNFCENPPSLELVSSAPSGVRAQLLERNDPRIAKVHPSIKLLNCLTVEHDHGVGPTNSAPSNIPRRTENMVHTETGA